MKKFEKQYEKETGKNPKCVMDGVEVDDAYTPAYVRWILKKIKHDRPTYDLKSLMRSSDKKIRDTLISLFRRKNDDHDIKIFENLTFKKIKTESAMYIVGEWSDWDDHWTITIYSDNIHLYATHHHSTSDSVIFRQRT